MEQASLWDGVLIIGGTIAFWYLVAKPLLAWSDFMSFKGFKVVPKDWSYEEAERAQREKNKAMRQVLDGKPDA